MSAGFGVEIRERWAARSMRVIKWHVSTSLHRERPVCDIETDGVTLTMMAPHIHSDDDPCGIWTHYVREGDEVGPWGQLLDYSTNAHSGPNRPHTTALMKKVTRDRYPRIFLNYRKDDSEAYAGRLHEVLSREFGGDDVFMDEFSIRSGEVWPFTIQQAVAHADVMVALIGPVWSEVLDQYGKPRIQSETDLVRREIVGALDRGIALFPVLVGGAAVPKRSAWEDPLRYLTDLQFHTLGRGRYWQSATELLISHIRAALAEIDADKPAT